MNWRNYPVYIVIVILKQSTKSNNLLRFTPKTVKFHYKQYKTEDFYLC